MTARVRVTRGRRGELGWMVQCDRCPLTSGMVPGVFGGVVVRATSFSDAIWWASWHAQAHDVTRCRICVRDRDVAPVVVLDVNTVKVDNRWFTRVPGGWQEVAA